MTPGEIKLALDAALVALARGGKMPVITDVHSIYIEGDVVHVGYDIVPDDIEGGVLFFEFERPAVVGKDDLKDFTAWLAWSDADAALH